MRIHEFTAIGACTHEDVHSTRDYVALVGIEDQLMMGKSRGMRRADIKV